MAIEWGTIKLPKDLIARLELAPPVPAGSTAPNPNGGE